MMPKKYKPRNKPAVQAAISGRKKLRKVRNFLKLKPKLKKKLTSLEKQNQLKKRMNKQVDIKKDLSTQLDEFDFEETIKFMQDVIKKSIDSRKQAKTERKKVSEMKEKIFERISLLVSENKYLRDKNYVMTNKIKKSSREIETLYGELEEKNQKKWELSNEIETLDLQVKAFERVYGEVELPALSPREKRNRKLAGADFEVGDEPDVLMHKVNLLVSQFIDSKAKEELLDFDKDLDEYLMTGIDRKDRRGSKVKKRTSLVNKNNNKRKSEIFMGGMKDGDDDSSEDYLLGSIPPVTRLGETNSPSPLLPTGNRVLGLSEVDEARDKFEYDSFEDYYSRNNNQNNTNLGFNNNVNDIGVDGYYPDQSSIETSRQKREEETEEQMKILASKLSESNIKSNARAVEVYSKVLKKKMLERDEEEIEEQKNRFRTGKSSARRSKKGMKILNLSGRKRSSSKRRSRGAGRSTALNSAQSSRRNGIGLLNSTQRKSKRSDIFESKRTKREREASKTERRRINNKILLDNLHVHGLKAHSDQDSQSEEDSLPAEDKLHFDIKPLNISSYQAKLHEEEKRRVAERSERQKMMDEIHLSMGLTLKKISFQNP